MKGFIFTLLFFYPLAAFAQLPPGRMSGRCSSIFGPIYNTSGKSYTASGTCGNGNPVNCYTDPMDDSPDYYCQTNGNKRQDPNPSVAADKVCGCIDS